MPIVGKWNNDIDNRDTGSGDSGGGGATSGGGTQDYGKRRGARSGMPPGYVNPTGPAAQPDPNGSSGTPVNSNECLSVGGMGFHQSGCDAPDYSAWPGGPPAWGGTPASGGGSGSGGGGGTGGTGSGSGGGSGGGSGSGDGTGGGGGTGSGSGDTATDPIQRIADVISSIMNQPIGLPGGGQPTVVPGSLDNASSANNAGMIVVALVLGIGGYIYFHHKHHGAHVNG